MVTKRIVDQDLPKNFVIRCEEEKQVKEEKEKEKVEEEKEKKENNNERCASLLSSTLTLSSSIRTNSKNSTHYSVDTATIFEGGVKYSRKATYKDIQHVMGRKEAITSNKLKDWIVNYQTKGFPEGALHYVQTSRVLVLCTCTVVGILLTY